MSSVSGGWHAICRLYTVDAIKCLGYASLSAHMWPADLAYLLLRHVQYTLPSAVFVSGSTRARHACH